MAEPVKVPQYKTADDYEARIRSLVEADRVRGARQLIAEAIEIFPDHPGLIAWSKILSPAQVVKVGGPQDKDRTPEYRWLNAHGHQYRGEWVAVLGDRLVAHDVDYRELNARLDKLPAEEFPPLLVRIQEE
ncbi:MAG TPA: DUF5678 domain-containing protein [Thermoanaerobaculia bacterium]|nr:DUF5678 domain-containing protein [Thermoanaerobaculia bacterium]